MLLETALLAWVWLGLAAFIVGCTWRAFRYLRAPVHLRWDLYPVAHEPGRGHGGSHLEEKEWWTKPRRTSLLGEVAVMMEEVVLLKGVFRHNRRVWLGSLPFHWGLYLMAATTVGLVLGALGLDLPGWTRVLAAAGGLGGALVAIGSLVLVRLRTSDPRLTAYTSPLDVLNLGLLALLGALSAVVALAPPGMAAVLAATADVLHGRAPRVGTLLSAQMGLAALFLTYLPATRMVHFFSKYFTYHEVRWDDRPREPDGAMDRALAAALDFGVTWSAPHVRTGGTWTEVVTNLPRKAGPGGATERG
jgi:nitrate reductase gamma subunit